MYIPNLNHQYYILWVKINLNHLDIDLHIYQKILSLDEDSNEIFYSHVKLL